MKAAKAIAPLVHATVRECRRVDLYRLGVENEPKNADNLKKT
jgi:hypothetical protein